MPLSLKTLIALLLISFAAGFITSFIIFDRKKSSPSETKSENSVTSLKKDANSVDASYQKQIETLTSQNIKLQEQLETSQDFLNQAKQETKQKEEHIQELIQGNNLFSNDDLFQKSFKTNPETYLSAQQLNLLEDDELVLSPDKNDKNYVCDSLAKEVSGYIEANHRKDSIYEIQLIQFDSLVSGKNLIIETSKKAYNDLHQLFDKSVFAQSTLHKENIALQKENKRQRFKSKLFAGGLMILSGFAAHIFLH